MAELDGRLRDALREPVGAAYKALDEDQQKALAAYLECDLRKVRAYLDYLEADSPYSTQQGIKSAEFPDVLDDEEGRYPLFSYDKLLNLKPLSKTDMAKPPQAQTSCSPGYGACSTSAHRAHAAR